MKKVLLSFAVLALLLPGAASADELVINGGFESATFLDGHLTGWDYTANVGAYQNWLGVSAYDGSWMAVLSPAGLVSATLDQDVDLSGYSTATLSFAYNVMAVDGLLWSEGRTQDYLYVYLGTHQLVAQTLRASDFSSNSTGWIPYSIDVPVEWLTSGALSFSFSTALTSNGESFIAFIDDVSIDATAPATDPVPEPGSMLLLGSGLIGLGGAVRRRFRR